MSDFWMLHPALDVPDLRPCAVQCAVLEHDPRVGLPERHTKLMEHSGAGADAMALLEAGWDMAFGDVSGDRVFLLKDFGDKPPVERVDVHGRTVWAGKKEGLFISSSGPEGRKWLVSKVVHHGDARYCWCIPFEARKGSRADLTLDPANRLLLGRDITA